MNIVLLDCESVVDGLILYSVINVAIIYYFGNTAKKKSTFLSKTMFFSVFDTPRMQ